MEEWKKIKQDLFLYSLFIIVGTIFYVFVIPTQIHISRAAAAEKFSPDTFPNILTIMFVGASVLGLLLAIFRYFKFVKEYGKPDAEKTQMSTRERVGIFVPYVVFLIIVAYAIAFKHVGFIVATLIFPPLTLLLVQCKKWHYYVIYYVFATLMYLLFIFVLKVPIR